MASLDIIDYKVPSHVHEWLVVSVFPSGFVSNSYGDNEPMGKAHHFIVKSL